MINVNSTIAKINDSYSGEYSVAKTGSKFNIKDLGTGEVLTITKDAVIDQLYFYLNSEKTELLDILFKLSMFCELDTINKLL